MDNPKCRLSLVFPFCFFFLFLAACAEMKTGSPSTGSVSGSEKDITSHYRFSDVPVPGSFKLDREKSFVYETGNSKVKIGRLFYSGMSKVDDVVAFYQSEMPNNGWTLVRIIEQANTIMLYEKQGWVCIVFINSAVFGQATIEIQLGPR